MPATIGYKGYAHATCISVNHVVTHGIPAEDKVLREGDILNIDVTPLLEGWHGDSSRMYWVGEPSIKARRLVEATYDAMMAGIAAVSPGARLGDVGHAIETVARRERFAVV
ncbi:MAG: M24 family metallopeptidase, partial [Fimbriimonas ginsengisoli]|nr:M24 family metallopeptidase [Fimbriimonas ginsengisoli]